MGDGLCWHARLPAQAREVLGYISIATERCDSSFSYILDLYWASDSYIACETHSNRDASLPHGAHRAKR